ncbi:hypothetical protein QBC46DRAFT_392559 [Diplogelasinospora grovesii]|uniref:Uncharacterized protein n=1 Tax=Diplogelasinospora grovesii TaxID=303347 RepID=A0AAN6N4A4_9PEZI|nr:hypothetical protein QBC46DRAFT_392559 [Diplogelasinospora grovesii]
MDTLLATQTCWILSSRAASTAAVIDGWLAGGSAGRDGALEKLAFLSTKLQGFRQHVDLLHECLVEIAPSFTMSGKLADIIPRHLGQSDVATTIMSEQLLKWARQPATPTQTINLATVAQCEELLVATSRVFIFITQLLAIHDVEDQCSRIDASEAQKLLARADAACQSVWTSKVIF